MKTALCLTKITRRNLSLAHSWNMKIWLTGNFLNMGSQARVEYMNKYSVFESRGPATCSMLCLSFHSCFCVCYLHPPGGYVIGLFVCLSARMITQKCMDRFAYICFISQIVLCHGNRWFIWDGSRSGFRKFLKVKRHVGGGLLIAEK